MNHQQNVYAFVKYFGTHHPWRTTAMIASITFAGIFEAVGVVTLLPLLELITTTDTDEKSQIAALFSRFFGYFGLEPTLLALLSLLVTLITLKAGLLWLAARQVGFTVADVATHLRSSLLHNLFRTRWEYYAAQPIGHVTNAVGTEAYRAAAAYREACNALSGSIQVVAYGFIALWVSWQVAIGALLVAALLFLILRGLMTAASSAGSEQTHVWRDLTSRLTDALRGIKPIRAMGREGVLEPLLLHDIQALRSAMYKQVTAYESTKLVQEPIVTIGLAAGIFIAFGVANFPMASVLLMTFIFYRVVSQVTKVQLSLQTVRVGESAFWALHDDIHRARQFAERRTGHVEVPRLTKGIVLSHVTFSYADRVIIRNLSLKIPVRQITAIYGPSGSGKSTLADIVMGLRTPAQGDVFIDDENLQDLNLLSWRRTLGYVPQDSFLLHDSIRNNVSLGLPSLTDREVEKALKRANCWDFVTQQDQGLDHIIGEGGSRLSGGQRQRIALARAIVHRPQVLILDEATASLDAETERAIIRTLRALSQNMTIIAISHQPALRDCADIVYDFSDNGLSSHLPSASSLE